MGEDSSRTVPGWHRHLHISAWLGIGACQRRLSEMSNIAPSSVSRTRTIRPEIAQRATLPVCLWNKLCGFCTGPGNHLTSAWAVSQDDWQLPLFSITVCSRSTRQAFRVQTVQKVLIGQTALRWMVHSDDVIWFWRSGLAMWHSAAGSWNTPPLAWGAICWQLVYSVLAARRRGFQGGRLRVTSIFSLNPSQLVGGASICRLYLRWYYICPCATCTCKRIHVRARGNLFMCHFVCWCSESGCNFSKLFT